MSDQNKSSAQFKELIDVLTRWDPERLNACIILHFDKETKRLQSISPMLNVTSIQELFNQLSDARDAIQGFLNDLMNKNLIHN